MITNKIIDNLIKLLCFLLVEEKSQKIKLSDLNPAKITADFRSNPQVILNTPSFANQSIKKILEFKKILKGKH